VSAAPDARPVQLESWEERAAILEFGGDMTRTEAEREAARLVFGEPTLPAEVEALRAEREAQAAAEAAARAAKRRGKRRGGKPQA